ncbi:MAG: ParM/StbA family protein [Methylococcales bacterium]
MNNQESCIVADDNGYAEHKICFWKGEPGKSEIVEMSLPSRAAIGSQALTLEGNLSGVYEINGTRWTVSAHVSDPENTRSGDYATSDLNTVLVNHALVLAGFSDKNVRLATGLPYANFFDENGIRIDYVSKVKKTIKRDVKSLGGSELANIIENNVYPESTAAWIDFSVDSETGELIAENENGVAVVDIGGNTTDVTYINAGSESLNRERSGTREIGVLHVRDKLKNLFKVNFEIDEVSDAQLDIALRTNKFKLFKKEHDVTELVEVAKKDVGQKVLNFVTEKVGKGTQLDYIVFVGGGAELLHNIINTYQHAVVPDRPQFSNARGMLKHWTFIVG